MDGGGVEVNVDGPATAFVCSLCMAGRQDKCPSLLVRLYIAQSSHDPEEATFRTPRSFNFNIASRPDSLDSLDPLQTMDSRILQENLSVFSRV